jgi:hypothetical protein
VTIILIPNELPEAQTFTYISDYVEVYDYDEMAMTNTLISIANVSNISYSINQPNVTITVSNNRIWFNGYYTTGESTTIKYFEPPYGNDITDTPSVAYDFNSVPPRKFIYEVNQPAPTGVTVTHTFTVTHNNSNSGANSNHTINRFVVNNVYAAYNFLRNYQYYTGEV